MCDRQPRLKTRRWAGHAQGDGDLRENCGQSSDPTDGEALAESQRTCTNDQTFPSERTANGFFFC